VPLDYSAKCIKTLTKYTNNDKIKGGSKIQFNFTVCTAHTTHKTSLYVTYFVLSLSILLKMVISISNICCNNQSLPVYWQKVKEGDQYVKCVNSALQESARCKD